MLNALQPLVDYGFYVNAKDVQEITGVLASLISGSYRQFICMKYIQQLVHVDCHLSSTCMLPCFQVTMRARSK